MRSSLSGISRVRPVANALEWALDYVSKIAVLCFTIALGITIGTWVAGLLTPVFGKIADTHGPRLVMPLTSVIVGVCFYWIGGMSAIWHFYVAYIIARGLSLIHI